MAFYNSVIIFIYLLLNVCSADKEETCLAAEGLPSMSINGNDVPLSERNTLNVEVNEWSPLQMSPGVGYSFGNYGLLILNTSININQDEMITFWNEAAFRMAVDGGMSHWYNFRKNLTTDTFLVREDPEYLTGDFDSIDDNLLQSSYNNKSIEVIETLDQNFTDFTKALEEVSKLENKSKLDSILVIVEHSGRLDVILSNIDTLHRADCILGAKIKVFLITQNSLSWLLKPGFHNIHIPTRLWDPSYWCGLIPFTGPTVVKTTGLKWNLNNQVLSFGKLVSSSNTYGDESCQREGVTIKTDKELLWSMATYPEPYIPRHNI